MKKLKLLLAACALLIGVNGAKAYTVSDLTSAGWEEVTSLPTSNSELGKYYYVLWATEADLMLGEENGSGKGGDAQENQLTGVYRTPADPASDNTKVWILEYSSTFLYGIRNLSNPKLLMQTRENATYRVQAAWEQNQSIWTKWNFVYADGKWSIQNMLGSDKGGGDNNWMGPWTKDAFVDNMVVAGNAGGNGNAKSTFKIYRKSRTAYAGIDCSSATKASPTDVTAYIGNNDFSINSLYWIRTQTSVGNQQFGNQTMESWTNNNVSVTQDLAEVPNGLYKLTVDMISGNNDKTAYVYAKGENEVNGDVVSAVTSKGDYATMSSEVAGKTLTADNINVTGHALTVGFKAPTGWIVADNFKLYYYGPTVAGEAIALPANGDMTANQWYYLDIPAAAEYNATATTLGDIVYTTDGTTLIEEAGSIAANFAATNNALVKARYYVKSASANNLAVAVAADTYTLNEATKTLSITDGMYLNSLTTFVVTYPNAETTSAAELALVGVNTAKLKKGGVEVATGTLAANNAAKTLTATFDAIALDPASTYTIEIEGGVFGYAGEAVNEAVSVSFNTGVIANGVYYFKKSDADLYITRGGYYGTEGVVDNFGLSFEATLQSDGTYTLKNIDHSLAANADKYLNGSSSTYTDQTAFNWTIETTEGGYYLRPSTTEYMAATAQGEYPYSYLSKTTDADAAYVWNLLSKSEYAAALAAAKNAQATAIATAAGVSATTVAGLESALAADFGATDMTSSITNAALTANMNGWTQVKYNGVTYKNADANGTTAEIWNSTGGVKQDVAGLPAGIYKVTVVATWRPGNLATATRVGAEANTTAWMYANTGTETNITQLKSWYEGGATINNRTDLVTNKANYTNTTYVYVGEGETLTIGLASPSFCVEPWFPFFDWTLTRYDAKPTAAEKTALASAISDAESKTLGFENGEYAPYSNVTALEALATAKAIDPETASGAVVVAATSALTDANWTANTGEVNAVFDGSFEYDYRTATPEGNINPIGWRKTKSSGEDATDVRYMDGDNAGLAATSSNKALFAKFSSYYGYVDGYQMPLKANTVYRISFVYGGWGDCKKDGYVQVLDPNESSVTMSTTELPLDAVDGNSNKDSWKNYTAVFKTNDAGNYVLGFLRTQNTQSQYVFGDIVLKKAVAEEIAMSETTPNVKTSDYANVTLNRTFNAGWNGIVLPINTTVDAAKSALDATSIQELSSISYDAENGTTLNFTEASSFEAGKPYFVKVTGNADAQDFTFNGVSTSDAAPQTISKESETVTYHFTGTYASKDITDTDLYFMAGTTLYHVKNTQNITMKPFRAWLENKSGEVASKISFVFEGEESTGIRSIENGKTATDNAWYDLQGRRVMKPVKGVYIHNGKKIVK